MLKLLVAAFLALTATAALAGPLAPIPPAALAKMQGVWVNMRPGRTAAIEVRGTQVFWSVIEPPSGPRVGDLAMAIDGVESTHPDPLYDDGLSLLGVCYIRLQDSGRIIESPNCRSTFMQKPFLDAYDRPTAATFYWIKAFGQDFVRSEVKPHLGCWLGRCPSAPAGAPPPPKAVVKAAPTKAAAVPAATPDEGLAQAAAANARVAAASRAVDARNAATKARYDADQAAYRRTLEAQRLQAEATQRAYDASMAAWRARVAACKAGDVSQCGA